MAPSKTSRKQEILTAALAEFEANGSSGARMQSIADNIGVTKAMIHYYFDTKQNLFEAVYRESVVTVFDGLMDVLDEDITLFQKIEQLIEKCMKVAGTKSKQLAFVIAETRRNPEQLVPIFEDAYAAEINVFEQQLNEAADNYEIASVDVRQLLLNIFSLCFYPALALEMNQSLLNIDSEEQMSALVEFRKGVVLDTVLNWLTS